MTVFALLRRTRESVHGPRELQLLSEYPFGSRGEPLAARVHWGWYSVVSAFVLLDELFHKPRDVELLRRFARCVDSFLDTGARLEFSAFPLDDVRSALLAAGFADVEMHERPPYETEHPTDRCYVVARKPGRGAG